VSSARQYFEAAAATSERAALAAGAVEAFFRIGGQVVGLRFAGPELVPIVTPPLQHLAIARGERPDLTVLVWDSRSTGIPLAPPAWRPEGYGVRGEIAGYHDARFAAVVQPGVGALNLVDGESGTAVFWVGDARRLTGADRAAPLLRVLHPWLARRGQQVLHAAAIGNPRGGVLVVGPGGAGKSTTALRCLDLGFAGDDYCLVSAGGAPVVSSLYGTARVDGQELAAQPGGLASMVANPEREAGEKALLLLTRSCPEHLTPNFPLRAVLVARVTGHPDTRLVASSRAEAFAALAPSTIGQLPAAGREALAPLAAALRKVTAYRLELGTDARGVRDAVAGLLR
jgi:hypothetical protein